MRRGKAGWEGESGLGEGERGDEGKRRGSEEENMCGEGGKDGQRRVKEG